MVFETIGMRPLLQAHIEAKTQVGQVLWPLGGAAMFFLANDFLYYWCHRIQHSRLLWRQHAVHHAIEDLNAANYLHWTEELTRIPFMTLPLALLVPGGLPVAAWAAGFTTLLSMYIHSPTRLHFGPFWRVLYDNRFHRIHHSVEPRHFDKNFGVITPLWDWLFGTLYVPAKDEWPDTGLVDEPEVDGLADYLWRPFRRV
jgi:sterol desaturase/sphingolipid hydroxylase (fatty acid hydroxylase superfamily)